MSALLAVAAAAAVLLALPGSGTRRARSVGPRAPAAGLAGAVPGRTLAAVAAGVAVALVLGGAGGVLVGAVAAAGLRVALARLERSGARREREQLARSAPLVVDLVAACLASGATLEASVRAAAAAVGGPAATALGPVLSAVALGADPAQAWRSVERHGPLAGLARAVARSASTGAPLSDLLPRVAERARAEHRARAEARIRTVSVRLTAPLGLAFLPAFVLLGVVPLVASWTAGLL